MEHKLIHTLKDIYIFKTHCSSVNWNFWDTFLEYFFMLHGQNTLYSAQGLPKVLRNHWKRQQLFLWVMNINVPKITHCPCMSLCSMPIALWHIFWNPKLFQTYTQLNLNSWIGGKQAGKKPIPVQTQSFDSRFRTSWLGVCPCKGSPRRIQKREIKQNNFLFPVTVVSTAI